MASPVSSTLSDNILRDDSRGTASTRIPHTPSPRKLKKLQSARTNEQHNIRSHRECSAHDCVSVCKRCGWHYPIPNPHYRQRRDHKKICPNRSFGSSQGKLGREEMERSGDYGVTTETESGESGLSGDHDLTDTAKSEARKTLSFGELEQEEVTARQVAQKETEREVKNEVERGPIEDPERTGDDKLKADSSNVPTDFGQHGSRTGREKVEILEENELGSHHVPKEVPQDALSSRSESGLELGSNSEVSSAAGEHETDPSDDMEFESSDIGEVAKRDESLPSDGEILEEETKNGASQHKHPHAQLQGGAESSHPGKYRADSEGGGKPTNVANLITKDEKGQKSTTSSPSDVTSDHTALAGNKRSMPSAKSGEAEHPSLRSKDRRKIGEITPAEEILEGQLSTARGREYDLESILKKQKTHDLICPVCGSQITNRIILRKKRRTFSSTDESKLPILTEVGADESRSPILTEVGADASNQEEDTKALTDSAGSQGGTWVQKCFGYLGLFRHES